MRQLFLLLIVLPLYLANAQKAGRVISGLVTSQEERIAMPGVLVYVKGSKNFSGTQQDGVYYIEVTATDSVLVFRYDGCAPKEVKLSHETNEYNVVLCRDEHYPKVRAF